MEYNNLIEPSLHKYVTGRGDVQVAGEMIDGLELFFLNDVSYFATSSSKITAQHGQYKGLSDYFLKRGV